MVGYTQTAYWSQSNNALRQLGERESIHFDRPLVDLTWNLNYRLNDLIRSFATAWLPAELTVWHRPCGFQTVESSVWKLTSWIKLYVKLYRVYRQRRHFTSIAVFLIAIIDGSRYRVAAAESGEVLNLWSHATECRHSSLMARHPKAFDTFLFAPLLFTWIENLCKQSKKRVTFRFWKSRAFVEVHHFDWYSLFRWPAKQTFS